MYYSCYILSTVLIVNVTIALVDVFDFNFKDYLKLHIKHLSLIYYKIKLQ